MAINSGMISGLNPVDSLTGEVWFEIITRHSPAVPFQSRRASKEHLIELLSSAGMSAYEVAVEAGFEGTAEEWLESLKGKSAYEIAVDNGYEGTYNQWVLALQAVYGIAQEDAGKFLGTDGIVSKWMFLTPSDVGLDGIVENVESRLLESAFQGRFDSAFLAAIELMGVSYNEETGQWGIDQGQIVEQE